MSETKILHISDVENITGVQSYPASVRHLFEGRHKARLGDAVGVTQFGFNITTMEPGSASSLRHWHEAEDEFVYVLSGELALIDDSGERVLREGHFVGFAAGETNGHHIVNKSDSVAVCIEVGSRRPGEDTVHYPDYDVPPVKR